MAGRKRHQKLRPNRGQIDWPIWILRSIAAISLLISGRSLFGLAVPKLHDITSYVWSRAYHEMFVSGWWYPQWLPQLWYGFGSPVFAFYNPFFYWLTEIPQLFGLSTIISVKLVVGVILLWGWWWMYRWLREFVSEQSALLGTSLMVLAPYYLGLIYLRGAYPEFLALNLIPGLMWALTRWLKTGQRKYAIGIVLTWTAIVLSHSLTIAVAGLIYLGLIGFLRWEDRPNSRLIWWAFGLPALAGLLTAFYWIPMLAQIKLINFGYMTTGRLYFATNFPELITLFNPWRQRTLSWVTLGWMHIAILVFGWVAYREVMQAKWRARWLAVLIAATLFLFLVTPYSDVAWNWFKGLDLFQFPSRFLGPTVLMLSVVAAIISETLTEKKINRIWLVATMLILTWWMYWPFGNIMTQSLKNDDLDVANYFQRYVAEELKTNGSTWADQGMNPNEYMPRKMDRDTAGMLLIDSLNLFSANNDLSTLQAYHKLDVLTGQIDIQTKVDQTMRWEYTLDAETAGQIRINQFEYPDWHIVLDGQRVYPRVVDTEPGQKLDISAGHHTLKIFWINSQLTTAARIFSGIAALLLLIGLWLTRRSSQSVVKPKTSSRRKRK